MVPGSEIQGFLATNEHNTGNTEPVMKPMNSTELLDAFIMPKSSFPLLLL